MESITIRLAFICQPVCCLTPFLNCQVWFTFKTSREIRCILILNSDVLRYFFSVIQAILSVQPSVQSVAYMSMLSLVLGEEQATQFCGLVCSVLAWGSLHPALLHDIILGQKTSPCYCIQFPLPLVGGSFRCLLTSFRMINLQPV